MRYIKCEVLDKIRTEIKKAVWEDVIDSFDGTDEVRIPRLDPDDVFEIIDKYKADGCEALIHNVCAIKTQTESESKE